MGALRIHDDEDGFYVFEDVAELFWPGEFGHDNHDAADRIKAELVKRGCAVSGGWYSTPQGAVAFDPESGCCEFHATVRPAVEYVCAVICDMLVERARLRAALS